MHQATDPLPCCQLTLVCNSPVSFDSLVRILVPLDTAIDATVGDCDPLQQQYTQALLACEQLHSLDAEAVPFAAFPCSQAHVQVISHKVLPKYTCTENLAVCESIRPASCLHSCKAGVLMTLMLQAQVAKVYKLLLQSQRAMGRRMDVGVGTLCLQMETAHVNSYCAYQLRSYSHGLTICAAAAKGGCQVGSPVIQSAQTGSLTVSAEYCCDNIIQGPTRHAGCMRC
jgi:hypothetical protein